MLRVIAARLVQAVMVAFVVGTLIFAASRLSGNPVDLIIGEHAVGEEREHVAALLGLDKPLYYQYWVFVRDLARGDFGRSVRLGVPVWDLLRQRMLPTAQLAGFSIALCFLVAVPLGVVSALKARTLMESPLKAFAVLGQSVPSFWAGIVGIWIFSVILGILPVAGRGSFAHFILPGLVLSWAPVAGMMRLVRSAMIEQLSSEYVKFARAKGVRPLFVVWKHALRNSFSAALSYSGLIVASLMTGSVVVEMIFAWPGLGNLAIQSFYGRDFPVIQGVVIFFTLWYVGVNLVIDILYVYLDPRIRYR